MIHRHDGARLRQAVSLHDDESQLPPELLQFRIEARAAHNERPEFEAEPPVHFAVAPPSPDHARPSRSQRQPGQMQTELPFDFVAKIFENAGNGDDHGYALIANDLNDLSRMYLRSEGHRSFKQQRNKYPLKLSEHVTEWQKIQNA